MFKNKKIRIDCELQSASACVFRVCKKIPSRGITHTQWRMHAHTLTVHFCSWRRRLGCNACVCVRVRSRMCMFCLSCVSVVARSRPKWRRHRRLPGGLDPPPPPLLWVDFGQLEMAPKCPAWVGWGGGRSPCLFACRYSRECVPTTVPAPHFGRPQPCQYENLGLETPIQV